MAGGELFGNPLADRDRREALIPFFEVEAHKAIESNADVWSNIWEFEIRDRAVRRGWFMNREDVELARSIYYEIKHGIYDLC